MYPNLKYHLVQNHNQTLNIFYTAHYSIGKVIIYYYVYEQTAFNFFENGRWHCVVSTSKQHVRYDT